MKRIINYTCNIVGIVGLIWALASWIDVIANNTGAYHYAAWNLFTMIF